MSGDGWEVHELEVCQDCAMLLANGEGPCWASGGADFCAEHGTGRVFLDVWGVTWDRAPLRVDYDAATVAALGCCDDLHDDAIGERWADADGWELTLDEPAGSLMSSCGGCGSNLGGDRWTATAMRREGATA